MVEIIMKKKKIEGRLRVTPPKNKKKKKLREGVGGVGVVGVRGVGYLTPTGGKDARTKKERRVTY